MTGGGEDKKLCETAKSESDGRACDSEGLRMAVHNIANISCTTHTRIGAMAGSRLQETIYHVKEYNTSLAHARIGLDV